MTSCCRFLDLPDRPSRTRLAALLVGLCWLLPGCGGGGGGTSSLGASTGLSSSESPPASLASVPVGGSEPPTVATPSPTPTLAAPPASPTPSPVALSSPSPSPPTDPEAGVRLAVPAETALDASPRGVRGLTILSPTVLQLLFVDGDGAPPGLVAPDGSLVAPDAGRILVTADGEPCEVVRTGVRRRVAYASPYARDIRAMLCLYVELASPLASGVQVTVTDPDETIWPATTTFARTLADDRSSPAIHVNQEGYVPGLPKRARIGCYLGSLGELAVPSDRFDLLDDDGKVAFSGKLASHPEQGAPEDVPLYQQVYLADFSGFERPGRYRLAVDGLGVSQPFLVSQSLPADTTRAYALGLYHKRCGTDDALPFTRFGHAACHLAPVQIPDMSAQFDVVNLLLAQFTTPSDPYQTAPLLSSVAQSLFPYAMSGSVDAHGGHHDAGDYSKYAPQSALLVHALVFAVDNFAGAVDLDNLGLPESGDGKSDLLQMARWEADYLCRIQDADGGFSYMTAPRDARYESNLLPEEGLPQVVFPKTTTATAAAVAALAQTASSPAFRAQFPDDAARYLSRARQGWAFLQRAWARYGRQGAFQELYTYGLEFADLDEIVWVETEMFLATGDPDIHAMLVADLKPDDIATLRWGWWRMFEAYGCAIRDYAFAARSGRVSAGALNPALLDACERQVELAGQDQQEAADASAYGLSYARYDKMYGNASWYFPSDRAFDAVVAWCLTPRPSLLDCVVSNIDFELGANPSDLSFLTGTGWRRPRVIVDQYALNDRRSLPPSGIPLGALYSHAPASALYGTDLLALSSPADQVGGYGIYDRFTDAWNPDGECTIVQAGRGLATHAFLMGRSWARLQPWRAAPASIVGVPSTVAPGTKVTAVLQCPGMDLGTALRVVWERPEASPAFGDAAFTFVATGSGPQWLEAEVQWRDGRRAYAACDFTVAP